MANLATHGVSLPDSTATESDLHRAPSARCADAQVGRGSACDHALVAQAVWDHVEARGGSGEQPPDALLDAAWHGKRLDAGGTRLAVERRTEALARVRAEASDATRPDRCHLTSLRVYFDDFAVARLDDWAAASTELLLLFKCAGAWRIGGTVGVGADCGVRQRRFNPRTAESEVLEVMQLYYESVDRGDAGPLARIFHAEWHMKNFEGGVLVAEDKPTFLRRVDGIPLPGYAEAREVAQVEVVHGCLAHVRVDKPAVPGVTVFNLVRIGMEWMIIDKAWSSAKP